MTAITITYTRAGFIVAADGRSQHPSGDPGKRNDEQQKIFQGRIGTADIAWALAGTVFVLSDDKSFSLVDEVTKAMQAANASKPQPLGCAPWLDIFAANLRESVTEARNAGLIPPFTANANCPDDSAERFTFATVFMAGYFCNGRPSSVQIGLQHHKGELVDPSPRTLCAASFDQGEHTSYHGSVEIALRYNNQHGDKRFLKYFHPLGQSLDDGLAHARGFIEACCDPLALEVDPVFCKNIGGYIHAAAVTPSGFQWLIEPKAH
jgi:hypothetical protein